MPAKHAKFAKTKNYGNDSANWSNLIPSADQKEKNTAEVAEDRRGLFGESILLCAAPRPQR